MPAITMTSERTGHWTKMRQPFVPFSGSGISRHTRFSADFITIMSGFRFSLHTGPFEALSKPPTPCECDINGRRMRFTGRMPPEMGPKSRNGSDWDFWPHTREYNAIAFLALAHGARGLVRITTLIMNNRTSKTITTAIKNAVDAHNPGALCKLICPSRARF